MTLTITDGFNMEMSSMMLLK